MGRPSRSRSLSVWMNGERVGLWTLPSRGAPEFAYDQGWVRSPLGRPLSLSLPFNVDGQPITGLRVNHYFDNLLPDSESLRRRIAIQFSTNSLEPFELLKAVGRDCVGAVQLLDENETPQGVDSIAGKVLSAQQVEQLLHATGEPARSASFPHLGADLRLSLAGAQDKTALLRHRGRWYVPRGSTPTTHILKLPLGLIGGRRADFTHSVENEWLCLRILDAYGLDVAQADVSLFGDARALVVKRFDRQLSKDGKRILRLPQEDFCQALGLSPLMKYEAEGGPGLKAIMGVLRQSVDAPADMRAFMAAQIIFWMLRAPDGHAKNFSIRLMSGGAFRLTPLYDVMSAWPVAGDGPNQWPVQKLKLAMALLGKNRHYDMHRIERRHFNSTARQLGFGADMDELIDDIVQQTAQVIDAVRAQLPPAFPGRVAESIFRGLRSSAEQLS